MADAASLPDYLRPLFWEVEFGDVRLPRHCDFVAERAITWLLEEDILCLSRPSPPLPLIYSAE